MIVTLHSKMYGSGARHNKTMLHKRTHFPSPLGLRYIEVSLYLYSVRRKLRTQERSAIFSTLKCPHIIMFRKEKFPSDHSLEAVNQPAKVHGSIPFHRQKRQIEKDKRSFIGPRHTKINRTAFFHLD